MSIFYNIPVKMKTQKNYKQEKNIHFRKLFLYEAQAIDFICVAILLHKKWGGGYNLMTYRRQW